METSNSRVELPSVHEQTTRTPIFHSTVAIGSRSDPSTEGSSCHVSMSEDEHFDKTLSRKTSSITLGEDARSLPPTDGGWRAWMFVACGFVIQTFIWSFSYSYGVIQSYYLSHPPFNHSSPVIIAAIGPSSLALTFIEGFLISLFLRRYPEYTCLSLWTGIFLFTSALLASSFTDNMLLLVILQGVCMGTGSALMHWSILDMLPGWFVERRGLASGIVLGGGSFGGVVFPVLLHLSIDHLGLTWTLRLWAALTIVITGIACLGVKPRLPAMTQKYCQDQKADYRTFIPTNLTFFTRPVFWCFALAYFLQGLALHSTAPYVAVFATAMATPFAGAGALAVFNVGSVLGQIITGFFTDRVPYTRVMLISALGCSLTSFLLWGFADRLVILFVFIVFFGAMGGGFPAVIFAGASDCSYPESEHARIALSAVVAFKGFSAVIGPVLSSVLLESGQNIAISHTSRGTWSDIYGQNGFGLMIIFVGSSAVATVLTTVLNGLARQRAGLGPKF